MGEGKAVTTIARERVESLSCRHAEPDWLKAARLASWEAYWQTPMPTPRDEAWHRTDISALDLSRLEALDFARDGSPDEQAHAWIKPALAHFKARAALLSQQALPGSEFSELAPETASKGVIFCSLPTALKLHEDKVRPYLSIAAAAEQDGKFGLMSKALFNCGLFLYVPPGVELELPFLSFISFNRRPGAGKDDTTGSAIFPRLLLVAGEASKVNLIHFASCPGASAQAATGSRDAQEAEQYASLYNGIVEIHAKPGASVSYLDVQEFDQTVYSITRLAGAIEQDATLTTFCVSLGGKLVKGEIATILRGRGAASKVLGVVLGGGNEHVNFNTIEEHTAPDTRSDINFRTALTDAATSVYQGIIRVAKEAQRTDAYQSNKNLLLGGEARADSIPKLEILADDVKCSHGATVGPVDQEQIFYLMSRGLTAWQAEELVVLGFFRKVLEQFQQAQAVEWIGQTIAARVSCLARARMPEAGKRG